MLVPITLRIMGGLLLPLLVIGSVWFPVIAQHRIKSPEITMQMIEDSRRLPADALWHSLRGDNLLAHGWSGKEQVISAAEDLLAGTLRLAGQRSIRVHSPFDAADLTPASSSLQLPIAGLVPVDLLLDAYELTGDARFFASAQASILAFARYERRAWVPKGLLWNDHAVANRVFVLSDFWRLYRHRDGFSREVARTVLQAASRAGAFLSDPRHFTVATNHGVMQNLALLRYAAAFPSLPGAAAYAQLAVRRLDEQMAFYMTADGVVLEHSAFYQVFGMSLMRRVFHYLDLLGVTVPREWLVKYRRAEEYVAQLQRPDGSLPVFGDTVWGSRGGAPASIVKRSRSWYPAEGIAVWWTDDAFQTVFLASYFPGQAHKHADDLSVLLWTHGQTWWNSLGYWPYGSAGRAQAESWNGSNGPHLNGEAATSVRTVGLTAFGSSAMTDIADAVRDGPGSYHARRQVVYLRPDTWLVLDTVSGAPRQTSTTRWTTGYGITVQAGESEGWYLLRSTPGKATLFSFFFGSPGTHSQLLPRSLGPYKPGVRPGASVPAVQVTQPAGESWAAGLWKADAADRRTPSSGPAWPKMTTWRGAERWILSIPAGPGYRAISRNGDRLEVSMDGRLVDSVTIKATDRSMTAHIREAFVRSSMKYPAYRGRVRLRWLSTVALLGVWAIQELVLAILSRRALRLGVLARPATAVLWIFGGLVLDGLLRRL